MSFLRSFFVSVLLVGMLVAGVRSQVPDADLEMGYRYRWIVQTSFPAAFADSVMIRFPKKTLDASGINGSTDPPDSASVVNGWTRSVRWVEIGMLSNDPQPQMFRIWTPTSPGGFVDGMVRSVSPTFTFGGVQIDSLTLRGDNGGATRAIYIVAGD